MASFTDVVSNALAKASDVQQILDALKGTIGKGVPISITNPNDAIAYALSVKNLDATNSRAGIFYKADGSVLLQIDKNGVQASPDGAQAAAKVVTTGDTGSVTSQMIVDGTIATADLAANAVVQRKFARGTTSGPTTTATGAVAMADPTISITTTGGDVLGIFVGSISCSTAGALMNLQLALSPLSNDGTITQWAAVAGNAEIMVAIGFWPAPTAGTFTLTPQWWTNAGTLTGNGTQRSLLAFEFKR